MQERILTYVSQGGISSFFILIVALFLLAVSLERLYFLYWKVSFDTEEAVDEVRQSILSGNYTKALQQCHELAKVPMLRMIATGITAAENGRDSMKAALNSELVTIFKNVDNRISYLALIASISTLLGLLGTIFGLIKTFEGMAQAETAQRAAMLGGGISEAMYSTGAGLVVGLLAMIMHTVCVNKAQQHKGEFKKMSYELITWIEAAERIVHE